MNSDSLQVKYDEVSCFECGSDFFVFESDYRVVYRGVEKSIPNVKMLRCSSCGIVEYIPDELRRIDSQIKSFYREIDGFLTPDEIKEVRVNLGYSQEKFADIFKVGKVNFTRYERGTSRQERGMDAALRFLREDPSLIRVLDPERPRRDNKNAGKNKFINKDYLKNNTPAIAAFLALGAFGLSPVGAIFSIASLVASRQWYKDKNVREEVRGRLKDSVKANSGYLLGKEDVSEEEVEEHAEKVLKDIVRREAILEEAAAILVESGVFKSESDFFDAVERRSSKVVSELR